MCVCKPKGSKQQFAALADATRTTPPAQNRAAHRPQASSRRTKSKHISRRAQRHQPLIVQHNYHDFAGAASTTTATPPIAPARLVAANGVSVTFPIKLYNFLQRVEETGQSHIVSWQPHGRCFVVHNPKLFSDILPLYFGQSKITSFNRQLNLYGFLRLTSADSPDRGGYYHECFLRGMPQLLTRIARSKVKGTGCRSRSNPSQEPNFWSMSWVGVGDALLLNTTPSDTTTTTSCVTETVTSAAAAIQPLSVVSVMNKEEPAAAGQGQSQQLVFFTDLEPLLKVGRTVSEEGASIVARPPVLTQSMLADDAHGGAMSACTGSISEDLVPPSFAGMPFHCMDDESSFFEQQQQQELPDCCALLFSDAAATDAVVVLDDDDHVVLSDVQLLQDAIINDLVLADDAGNSDFITRLEQIMDDEDEGLRFSSPPSSS